MVKMLLCAAALAPAGAAGGERRAPESAAQGEQVVEPTLVAAIAASACPQCGACAGACDAVVGVCCDGGAAAPDGACDHRPAARAAVPSSSLLLLLAFIMLMLIAHAFKLWPRGLAARSLALLRTCSPLAADARRSHPASFTASQSSFFVGYPDVCEGAGVVVCTASVARASRRGRRGGRGVRRRRSDLVLGRLRHLLRRAMVRLFASRFYDECARQWDYMLAMRAESMAAGRCRGTRDEAAARWRLEDRVWGCVFWWLPSALAVSAEGNATGWGEPPPWFREQYGPACYPASYVAGLRLRWERQLRRQAEAAPGRR